MDVYFFNITVLRNRDVFNEKLKEVSESRIKKIKKLKNTDDRLRSLGAGLLMNFVRKQYHVKEELRMDKFGKPYFVNSKIHFNISHSGNFVVMAVSDWNIGIDVQRMKLVRNRVAEKNFLPRECEYINELEDDQIKQQRFCEIWTIKEAYLKNQGIGLRKPLNSFEVDLSEDVPKIVDHDELRVVQFKMDTRYVVAVCADQRDREFRIEEIVV